MAISTDIKGSQTLKGAGLKLVPVTINHFCILIHMFSKGGTKCPDK